MSKSDGGSSRASPKNRGAHEGRDDRGRDGRSKAALVVAANRLPVAWNEALDEWETSPGGLVSALAPILQEAGGAWVGWTGEPDHAPEPFDHDGIRNCPIRIDADEVENHYLGFCNATIWPLYHNSVRTPEYHRHWWRPYEAVNRRFAETIADSLRWGGTVWVHDYQLQLVPGYLRERRSDAAIGFFLHIPFPPCELFGYLPWRRNVLRRLLAADVVAFQTQSDADNLAESAVRYVAAKRVDGGVEFDGRFVRLQAAPISIDTGAFESLARSPEVEAQAASLRRRLGPDKKILLAVDRLDYTKGIAHRLKALATFFERRAETAAECAVVQVAVPTREDIADYVDMRGEVERLIGQLNGRFGRPGHTPFTYMYTSLTQEDLVACYRAADVMLVTPLCDGMNLVAKEFVATRFDNTGVLVLSEFAGAAVELEEALQVNPYDSDWLAYSVDEAVNLAPDEAKARMMALRNRVWERDVFDWSRDCLEAIEQAAPKPVP
ncbi:MAG: alpha,alpha-trehalose-phosphate synthase (UDP-forming) [Gemmatimonadota bacterium]